MPSVKSAPFSFIRFEDLTDAYCPEEAVYKLPAFQKYDHKFQFIIEGDIAESEIIQLGVNGFTNAFTPAVEAVKLDYKYKLSITGLASPFLLKSFAIGAILKTYNLSVTFNQFLEIIKEDFNIEPIIEGDSLVFSYHCKLPVQLLVGTAPTSYNTVTYYWNQAFVAAPGNYIPGYDPMVVIDNPKPLCFRYTIHRSSVDDILATSNEFEIMQDDCYISKLVYKCDENAFAFIYGESVENVVWLPFYLSRPSHPQKRTVYIKSNGRQQLLSANIEKEYLLQTNWMIELFHECMTVALHHDTVIIQNANIREKQVEVISSDNYAAEWNGDYELITAPAKAKIKVASFGERNSNCGEEGCGPSGVCAAPTDLGVFEITTNSATAFWTSPGGISTTAEINLFRADTPGTPVSGYPLILGDGVLEHTFTGLEPATDYQFQVRYHCGATQSAWVQLAADPDFTTL